MQRCLFRLVLVVLLFSNFASPSSAQTLVDPGLKVQRWVKGLDNPTGAAFIDGGSTTLVIEKNTGRVKVVRDRQVVGTALDLPVATEAERGLLGVAVSPTFATDKHVYLYYTRSATSSDGSAASDNRVERFTWNGASLTFDRHILRMPAAYTATHNGGKIVFGPDNKLYTVIGDLGRAERTQNSPNPAILRTGAILRVNPSGTSATSNPFYDAGSVGGPKEPVNDIYAYGIRNGYGLAFDPIKGTLWDTENGPESWDEINRVTPGFNSGWRDVQGPLARNGFDSEDDLSLFDMGEAAHYEDPKFAWKAPVAPTDAFFMDSARLGRQYAHDLFVGSVRGGNLYHFDLTRTRNSLRLDGVLSDLVADNAEDARGREQEQILFGTGFGVVTDLLSGPGGMYVVSLTNGSLYRITTDTAPLMVTAVPEPSSLLASLATFASVFIRRRRRRPR